MAGIGGGDPGKGKEIGKGKGTGRKGEGERGGKIRRECKHPQIFRWIDAFARCMTVLPTAGTPVVRLDSSARRPRGPRIMLYSYWRKGHACD